MSHRGPIQPLPIRRTEREFFAGLEHMLGRPSPFMSCLLPIGSSAQIAASRQAVEAAYVGPAGRDFATAVIGEVVEGGDGGSVDGMAIAIRAGDGSTYLQHYPDAPPQAFVESAHLPRLGPVIEAEQRLRHHLLVVASEEGIDVMTFPRHGKATSHSADTPDMERRVELVIAAIERTETRLVIVSGEPDSAAELARRVAAGVPCEVMVETAALHDTDQPGSDPVPTEAVVHSVENDHARAISGALREWNFERSRGNATADAASAVEALRNGRARLLLIHDDMDDKRELWVGEDPRAIALDSDDAARWSASEGTAESEMVPVRLVDALLRSAILQRVAVRIIPGLPGERLPGGIGVLYEDRNGTDDQAAKTA